MAVHISKQNIIDASAITAAGALGLLGVDHFSLAGALVCARSLDYWLDKRTVSPRYALSEEQGKVVDFLTSRFDMLCLGDTNHLSPAFYSLITDDAFQRRLFEKNFKTCIFEMPVDVQKIINALEAQKISRNQFESYLLGEISSPVASTSLSKLRARLLGSAIARRQTRYYAADIREFTLVVPSVARKIGNAVNTTAQVFFPKRFPMAFGFLTALAIAAAKSHGGQDLNKQIQDDTATVQGFLKQLAPGEPCWVAYGAGHFGGATPNGNSMVSLLVDQGRHPVVVNIYSDEKFYSFSQKFDKLNPTQHENRRPADIDFVLERNGRPGRIVFHNESLQSAYQAAKSSRSELDNRPSEQALAQRNAF